MPEIEPAIPEIENATPEIEPATPEMENAIPEIEPAIPELHNGSSKMVFKDNVLFGKYDLGKLLGCGAFSKVYHARSIRTGQSVAVKVIIKKKIAGTTMVSNIKREITIMRRLRHPSIVRLHEVLATYTKIYFVMELVKGGELFAKVAKGRFTEDLARKYFRQLISAIGYCHARGVCHRDLKPENLLIDENGDLKVCDFGLSAVKEQVRPDGLLHTLCGTPAYVAPDILTKTGYDGAKVDVWSCGIILYVLTVGSLPFDDPNLMSMYRKICKGEFKCPRSMSSDLKKFLSKLINTNSNKRITIDEITEDPWFTKGEYEKLKFLPESEFFDDELKDYTADDDDDDDDDDEELKSKKRSDEASCSYSLNAFDLISFSPGLDLSGLVNLSRNPMEDVERFLSKFSAQMILEKIEALAVAENLKVNRVTKRDRVGIQMVGQNGNFVAKVEIGELIEELLVVEVTRKAGDALSFNELWKKKIRLELDYLVYGGDDNDDDNGNEEDNDGGNESVYGDVF